MKYIATIFILLLAISAVQPAYAADETSFNQNRNTEAFNTLTITAESDEDIRQEFGLNLIIPAGLPILWERETGTVVFSGTAADKVVTPFSPTLSADGYIMNIQLNADFTVGQTLIIDGLKVRTYDRNTSNRSLVLDVDRDEISDRTIHLFRINDTARTDFIPPYDPEDFQAVYNAESNRVEFSWKNPPDYDLNQMNLWRDLTRDGKTSEQYVTSGMFEDHIDYNIQTGDQITYRLWGGDDNGNLTVTLEKTVSISTGEQPEEPPAEPPAEDVDEELAELERLYNYYNVRYQIKCLAATANLTSSACLWAKINLVYTQEKLNQLDVDVSLSEHDLYLMSLRVKWPEARYQTKCAEAETPDKTCPALGKSLKRIHYFIDEE